MSSFLRLLILSVLLSMGMRAGDALEVLKGCKLVPQSWADGDSFVIQTAAGVKHTVRLYGADCIEWHVSDDTDAQRLRTQRRYFGISLLGGSIQSSVDQAKLLGQRAAEETVRALSEPFTVHTAFSDARGDSRYKRVYGFVTTADGQDLAERLVRMGLARAYGVYRETPKGKSAVEYRASLEDEEFQAAKKGLGAWAKTNWDMLAAERRAERLEKDEIESALTKPMHSNENKINPNTADRDQLMRLPAVGEVTADRIIQLRPYSKVDDLLKVNGIGPLTLKRMKPFLQIP